MYHNKRLMDCTFREITYVWNEAFSNYSVNMNMSIDQMGYMIGKRELSPQNSIVIFDKDIPIGFLLTSIKEINGIKKAWNGGTGVSPKYQGRGLGKLLLEEMVGIYKKEGVELATLEVLKSNLGAISLYERYSYKKIDSLIVLKEGEQHILESFNQNSFGVSIHSMHPLETKNLSFYNNNVPWSSLVENIQNGKTIVVKDEKGLIIGYALYNETNLINGEKRVVLHQCEVVSTFNDKRKIVEILISSIYQSYSNSTINFQTGDFTSGTEEVIQLLNDKGFLTLAERYLMNALIT